MNEELRVQLKAAKIWSVGRKMQCKGMETGKTKKGEEMGDEEIRSNKEKIAME